MYTILLVIHTIVVVFMILMVLVQRSDSDGLGGLGGGGGNQFLTGRGAANLMTRTTAILAAIFFLTSLTLAIMASHMTDRSIVDTITTETPATTSAIPGKDDKILGEKENVSKMEKPAKAEPAVKSEPVVPKPE